MILILKPNFYCCTFYFFLLMSYWLTTPNVITVWLQSLVLGLGLGKGADWLILQIIASIID